MSKITIEEIKKVFDSYDYDDCHDIAEKCIELDADNRELVKVLKMHHQWQDNCEKLVVPDTEGNDMIINCEYYESNMREVTVEALAKHGGEE